MANRAAQSDADSRSDADIMAALARGDRSALGMLYRRHAAYLLGVAVHFLRERRDAEDVLHDVLLEAWQRTGQWEASRGSVRAWLALRVRSRCLDRIRTRTRRAELVATRLPPPAPAADPSLAPDRQRAREAVSQLSQVQRDSVELAYFEGLSASEIAERCSLPLGTVKSRLAAALASLRKQLSQPEEIA